MWFYCTFCEAEYTGDESLVGKNVQCRTCFKTFTVFGPIHRHLTAKKGWSLMQGWFYHYCPKCNKLDTHHRIRSYIEWGHGPHRKVEYFFQCKHCGFLYSLTVPMPNYPGY